MTKLTEEDRIRFKYKTTKFSRFRDFSVIFYCLFGFIASFYITASATKDIHRNYFSIVMLFIQIFSFYISISIHKIIDDFFKLFERENEEGMLRRKREEEENEARKKFENSENFCHKSKKQRILNNFPHQIGKINIGKKFNSVSEVLQINPVCGVYGIYNRTNNAVYIGESVDIKKRWLTHFNDLNNNCHHNINLIKAYEKSNKDTNHFESKVIKEIPYIKDFLTTKIILRIEERNQIIQHQSLGYKIYNTLLNDVDSSLKFDKSYNNKYKFEKINDIYFEIIKSYNFNSIPINNSLIKSVEQEICISNISLSPKEMDYLENIESEEYKNLKLEIKKLNFYLNYPIPEFKEVLVGEPFLLEEEQKGLEKIIYSCYLFFVILASGFLISKFLLCFMIIIPLYIFYKDNEFIETLLDMADSMNRNQSKINKILNLYKNNMFFELVEKQRLTINDINFTNAERIEAEIINVNMLKHKIEEYYGNFLNKKYNTLMQEKNNLYLLNKKYCFWIKCIKKFLMIKDFLINIVNKG